MLKTGELLMLSTEQYSDQTYGGPFEVLKDFDIHEVADLVGKMPAPLAEYGGKSGPDDVIEYLKANEFIVDFPCHAFHLGCYGNINVTPEK